MVQKPIKSMSPKSDLKYTGSEPDWKIQPDIDLRSSQLTAAFTWYNYHYGKKEAKEIIMDWLTRQDRRQDVKNFGRVSESNIVCTYGWVARMNLRGLQLSDHESNKLENYIATAIANHTHNAVVMEPTEEVDVVSKPNIQDRLKEKISEAAGEIDGMFDDMIVNGNKMTNEHKPINILRGMNVAPQLIGVIRSSWLSKRSEFMTASSGEDAELWEGYGHYGKIGLRNMVKFCDQVIADCDSYVQIKKVERKPRKKKPVSAEKLTQKFKYLREFAELKLTSESVTKLVGASEAWLYDTAKRKLVHVTADSHVQALTVKGSAIIGFDTATSVQKTLRKPAEQLKTLMSSGAPAARKFFKDIKSTETKFNGRGNDNMILLKVR